MASAAFLPTEVLRETYENGPYYSDKNPGDLGTYGKESIFAEEDTPGRIEGQVRTE